jgi:hypothetical protein
MDNLQLIDWRFGRTPRKEVIEYFESKGYLRVSEGLGDDNEVFDVYHIEVDSMSVGRMIEELRVRYDVMITETMFAIDTKGNRFRQR